MRSGTAPPRPSSTQVCAQCNCSPKKTASATVLKQTQPRIACPVPSCTSSFSRPSDLARHRKSIHGPKTKCGRGGCEYMTGRADKMKEHVRKLHPTDDAGVVFSDVWPWGSPTTTVNFEASCAQYLMESCMTGLSGDCFEASIDRDVVVFDPYGSWRTPRDYVVLYPVT